MDAMENPVLEPRAERIARYKAERRRELSERYGITEELPSKWTRKDGREVQDTRSHNHRGLVNSESAPSISDRLHNSSRSRGVYNGVEAGDNHKRQGSQDTVVQGGEGDGPHLHTRVSVGQLRSALLQQTGTGAQPDTISSDAASASLDLAVKPGSDGARRRTRRYLPSGSASGSASLRKTSDRFRTQPITANEMEESSGVLDEAEEEDSKGDVKTDDRAKMSVAAKMSLFKEMEKSAPASSFLKPRSGSVSHERRARRTNDHRFLTQPITCEEMVAISAPKHTLQIEPESAEPEPVEDDESCKMSMSEKLALFNKLSLPEKMTGGHVEGPPERRRQKGARYRTQPITVEEVSLLQKGPIQLPAFSLDTHLSDRQQALSINIKPSELRLSQQRLDPSALSSSSTEQKHQEHNDNEPTLKGILKKSRSGGLDWTMDTPYVSVENGGDREAIKEESSEVNCEALNVEGAPVSRAPWRQRARGRRETIAGTLIKAVPEQEVAPNDRSRQSPVQRNGHDKDNHPTINEEGSSKMHHQAPRVKNSQQNLNGRSTKDDSDTHHTDHSDAPQSWGPVFASVFSSSRPQYIMCFNQTNQSFEAQEVASPTKDPVQPLWRQKGSEDESSVAEAEELNAHKHKKSEGSQRETESEVAIHKETVPSEEKREDVPAASPPHSSDGGFHSDDQTLSVPCAPRREASATDTEQDIFCQTNTPVLTSAVAQHRRSVRPSRRTQGSRNPLRALAAREDIQQDFMGEAAEERLQSLQKSKNCSSGHSQTCPSEDVSNKSSCTTMSPVPHKNLMLILIKGRRHVQVRLVEPSVQSLNSGDCYLLVTPKHCILWSGEFANEQEKAKGHDLAFIIQNQRDLGCQAAEVVHLEEGLNSESSQASDFWSHLGGRTQYRGASAPEEDDQFERGVVESNCVYRLVEDRLVPHEEAWACIPSSSLLDSTEVLVFDFGSEGYLWCGQEVSPSRKSVAQQLAHQVWTGPYDYSNCRVNPLDPTQCNPSVPQRGEGRPGWALFSCVSQNNETSLFREKFLGWRGKTVSGPVINETQPQPPSPDPLSPCDAKALVSGQFVEDNVQVHGVLSGVDVQRGHGVITLDEGQMELRTLSVDTWHVQEFDDSEVPVECTGQLHEGDSYVIRWTYTFNSPENGPRDQKEKTAFFLWRGRHSSVTGRDTAAFLSIGMNNQDASQIVVPQGKEPPCFLQLFKGGLVIHKGTREEPTSKTDWRLFGVRGELPEEGSLLEVDCCCSGLRSRGCVVLLNSQRGAVFLWTGCKTQACAREVGKKTVERLTQMCPPELGVDSSNPLKVQTVEEGSEPAEFWAALGHMDRKAYDCMLQDPGKYNFTPRLFHLSASSGSFRAEELQSPTRFPGLVMAMPFVQETLYAVPLPALFLLDNRLEVYLWQRGQPEETDPAAWSLWHNERRCALKTALQYCKEMNPRRPPQSYLIYEGSEPLTFTNVFPNWDRSLGSQTQAEVARVKLTLVQDALAQLMKTQYPLEELLQSPLPEGVDPQHLEVYLSDQDFQTILEMKRDEYASLPSWKQIDLKKSKGLLS